MSVLGNGTPMVPVRRVGQNGLPSATGAVSVRPYPSTSRPPATDSHSSTTSSVSFIAPEMQNRADFRLIPRSRERRAVLA